MQRAANCRFHLLFILGKAKLEQQIPGWRWKKMIYFKVDTELSGVLEIFLILTVVTEL